MPDVGTRIAQRPTLFQSLYPDGPAVCATCLEPYVAGHLCGFERVDWNRERKASHRCCCDTCYAAHKAGRPA